MLMAHCSLLCIDVSGAVKLLSTPVSCGYVQNPISVYYCYSEAGSLEKCIAEVKLTFISDCELNGGEYQSFHCVVQYDSRHYFS